MVPSSICICTMRANRFRVTTKIFQQYEKELKSYYSNITHISYLQVTTIDCVMMLELTERFRVTITIFYKYEKRFELKSWYNNHYGIFKEISSFLFYSVSQSCLSLWTHQILLQYLAWTFEEEKTTFTSPVSCLFLLLTVQGIKASSHNRRLCFGESNASVFLTIDESKRTKVIRSETLKRRILKMRIFGHDHDHLFHNWFSQELAEIL